MRLDGARDPDGEPAAAPGDEDGVHVGQVLEDLDADRAVAGHHVFVLDRMQEDAVDAFVPRLDDQAFHQRSAGP